MEASGKIKFDGSGLWTLADLFAKVEMHDRRVAEILVHPDNAAEFRRECHDAKTGVDGNVFWGARLVLAGDLKMDDIVVRSE